jgi:hypothetical protein
MQKLHHSAWDHEIWYAVKSSKDGQPLIRPLLREKKSTNIAVGRKFKFIIRFYGDNAWTVALGQIKFCPVKIMDMHTGFIWIGLCKQTCLIRIKFEITVFIWHDNSIILKPQFHFMCFIEVVLNIIDTNTTAEKYSMLYINLCIFRVYNMG